MADDIRVKYCQQQIIKLDLEIKASIQDIQRCEGPLDVLENLNRSIVVTIQEIKTKIEELERFANEQDKETVKICLLKDVDTHRKQLITIQSSLRRANLACQLSMERKEKEELFSGTSELRKRPLSTGRALANTSSGITESLMSLSRMMSDQVHQSEQTMGNLVSSSKQVGDTFEEFKSISGHISNSRKLLTKYGRRECTDKLLILLALVFFFASVLYVIKKRLLSSSDNIYYSDSA